MKHYVVSGAFLLLTLTAPAQHFINRFAVSAGYAQCVQQEGVSPFSNTANANRHLQSAYASVHYTQPIASKWSLVTGLQYIEKGWRASISNWDFEYQQRLFYLQLPIWVQFHAGKKHHFYCGVMVSRLIGEVYSFNDYDAYSLAFSSNNDYYSRYGMLKSWDFGSSIGYGYTIHPQLELTVNIEKSFIRPSTFYGYSGNQFRAGESFYPICFLAGVKYRF